jgi:glycosyltransferase involved in cell wall biosynthesis
MPATRPGRQAPTVSVIIPCKNSADTIRGTTQALFGQDYPALEQIILVGDINDPTWAALDGIDDPRLIVLEQEPTPGRRDPNVKRDKGIRKASGDLLALVDSDVVMDRSWLSRAVALLQQQGGGLVAGGMRSIDDTFWGRFVDRNALAAKTPRLPVPYSVTAENFGRRGYKPPITANAVFTRELYDACPLDIHWPFGYEDYEWFWRLASDGHQILFTDELTAAHQHRRSYQALAREYQRASFGCAQYIRAHPDSPLARKRRRQSLLLPVAALAGLALAAVAVIAGYGLAVVVSLLVAALALAATEVIRSRSLEGVAYAVAGLGLGAVFTYGLATALLRRPPRVLDTAPPSVRSRGRTAQSPVRPQ